MADPVPSLCCCGGDTGGGGGGGPYDHYDPHWPPDGGWAFLYVACRIAISTAFGYRRLTSYPYTPDGTYWRAGDDGRRWMRVELDTTSPVDLMYREFNRFSGADREWYGMGLTLEEFTFPPLVGPYTLQDDLYAWNGPGVPAGDRRLGYHVKQARLSLLDGTGALDARNLTLMRGVPGETFLAGQTQVVNFDPTVTSFTGPVGPDGRFHIVNTLLADGSVHSAFVDNATYNAQVVAMYFSLDAKGSQPQGGVFGNGEPVQVWRKKAQISGGFGPNVNRRVDARLWYFKVPSGTAPRTGDASMMPSNAVFDRVEVVNIFNQFYMVEPPDEPGFVLLSLDGNQPATPTTETPNGLASATEGAAIRFSWLTSEPYVKSDVWRSTTTQGPGVFGTDAILLAAGISSANAEAPSQHPGVGYLNGQGFKFSYLDTTPTLGVTYRYWVQSYFYDAVRSNWGGPKTHTL